MRVYIVYSYRNPFEPRLITNTRKYLKERNDTQCTHIGIVYSQTEAADKLRQCKHSYLVKKSRLLPVFMAAVITGDADIVER